tara:strand:- start:524 stop:793 length:270 start_codon:yes stop_codon:yes gene_type:complete
MTDKFNVSLIADEVKETDDQPIKHWDIQYMISCTFLGTKEEALIKAEDDGEWLFDEAEGQGMWLKECTVHYNGEPEEWTLKNHLGVDDD